MIWNINGNDFTSANVEFYFYSCVHIHLYSYMYVNFKNEKSIKSFHFGRASLRLKQIDIFSIYI